MYEPGDFKIKDKDWQSHCVDIKQRGSVLFQTGHYCDCKIIVGRVPSSQETFEAHKLVLAMASPVFEAMFFRGENEETFYITDVKPEPFRAMMNYIYSEDNNINSYHTALDLYYCATKYMLLQLSQVCVTFMACNVTPWNACHALQMGHVCDEQALINKALQVIKSNIGDVLHHQSFCEVEVSTVATIFSIKDLKVENELDLFLALKQYALARMSSGPEVQKRKGSPHCGVAKKKVKVNDLSENIEEPKVQKTEDTEKELLMPSLQPAVSAIRFLTLTSEQFIQHVARSGLLTTNNALALLANIVCENARLPVPDGFSDLRQPRIPRPLPKPVPSLTERSIRLVVDKKDEPWGRVAAKSRGFELAGRRWTARLLPRRECSTGASQHSAAYLGLFVRCLQPAPAPWSCRVSVEFRLLAARLDHLPRTVRIDETFTSANPYCGLGRFVNITELSEDDRFVSNNKITFELRLKILDIKTEHK